MQEDGKGICGRTLRARTAHTFKIWEDTKKCMDVLIFS